jgi:hypothetical protein
MKGNVRPGGDEKCIQNFVPENWGDDIPRENEVQAKREDNIKKDHEVILCECVGLIQMLQNRKWFEVT